MNALNVVEIERATAEVDISLSATIVFDKSVLVADPAAMSRYERAAIVVPLVVVEELDGLKTRTDHVGQAAREALRTIEELRVAYGGDLRTDVPLTGTSTFRVVVAEADPVVLDELAAVGLARATSDNQILALCVGMRVAGPLSLISNDTALRIKAAQLGLHVAPHVRAGLDGDAGVQHESPAWPTAAVAGEAVRSLFRDGSILTGRGRRRRSRRSSRCDRGTPSRP